jgi:Raf kinase inhibitor-like YbhB/YbcL family protein
MKVGFLVVITVLIVIIAIVELSKPDLIPNDTDSKMETLTITSAAFAGGGLIPSKYTCDESDTSPPLTISEVPSSAESLVLIMDDPDAPVGTWDHWVVYNILPTTTVINEGEEPRGKAGVNSWKKTGYGGPCPPDKEHRYSFRVYALDVSLELRENADKKDVEEAMEGHILSSGELIGRYNRSQNQ